MKCEIDNVGKEINMHNLVNGIYILELIGNVDRITQKMVINRN